MIKELLILAYILAVLVMSSLVRADVSPEMTGHGIIRSATLTPETGVLDIQGFLPSPCEIKPTVVVDQLDSVAGFINLSVAAVRPSENCFVPYNEVVGQTFDISLDLKEFPLMTDKVYRIHFQNGSKDLSYKALKSQESFDFYKIKRQSFKGILVYFSAQEAANLGYPQSGFALQNGDQTIRVFSPDLDLEKYKGVPVSVLGYPVDTASLTGTRDPKMVAVGPSGAKTVPVGLAQSSHAQMVIVPVSVTHVGP